MLDNHPIFLAALTGFITGVLICIPVGPVNLTIINEATRRGFRWAMLISAGALTMEVVYCFVAFTGFASFFQKGLVKAAMELTSFVFLLFLGMRFLTASAVPKAGIIEKRVEEKLHPHSAYMIGFVRVMSNPGVLLFWIVLAANLISRDWVNTDYSGTKMACVAGVALGAGLWFTGLSYVVSLRHQTISEKWLLRMEHFSGFALLALAAYHGLRIILDMAHHRI
jgi:threonine/homoserine/homoserine lactone efflux protein